MLDGSFSALHPKSIAVAFAIRDAVEAGAVESSAIDPIIPGAPGYWRAVSNLNHLHQRLSAAAADQFHQETPVSILFIDSGLWARYTLSPHGVDLEAHTAGARDGETVIVTSEAILAAIVDRRMAVDVALARGAMVIDGLPPSADDSCSAQQSATPGCTYLTNSAGALFRTATIRRLLASVSKLEATGTPRR
jgi:hypothetical protein